MAIKKTWLQNLSDKLSVSLRLVSLVLFRAISHLEAALSVLSPSLDDSTPGNSSVSRPAEKSISWL